jgi:ATP-dependent Clp protease ATP-binding subunit ClpX
MAVMASFIPEFISRLPSITTLSALTVTDLRRILTDVKGSLISQYQALFGYSGVEIRFTNPALDEICRQAAARGGGARGLRGIMVI